MQRIIEQFNEFNGTVQWYMKKMEGFLQNKGFCDTDEKHNIRLSILGGQLYDMADCSIRVKLSYMFEYPTCKDIPIEYSSCNEAKIITKEYVDDFMTKNDTNIILEDWKKIFLEWCEIKNAENRELAIKQIEMLVKTNKLNEDFD